MSSNTPSQVRPHRFTDDTPNLNRKRLQLAKTMKEQEKPLADLLQKKVQDTTWDVRMTQCMNTMNATLSEKVKVATLETAFDQLRLNVYLNLEPCTDDPDSEFQISKFNFSIQDYWACLTAFQSRIANDNLRTDEYLLHMIAHPDDHNARDQHASFVQQEAAELKAEILQIEKKMVNMLDDPAEFRTAEEHVIRKIMRGLAVRLFKYHPSGFFFEDLDLFLEYGRRLGGLSDGDPMRRSLERMHLSIAPLGNVSHSDSLERKDSLTS